MENFTLQELIRACGGEFLLGDPHARISRISIDTRTLRRGDYYVALTGGTFDGHDFLKQAVEKKAGGLIVNRHNVDLGNPFPSFPAVVKVPDTMLALGDIARAYRRKWDMPLIGITGSNGKTTTKEMLASILSQTGTTLATSGNFNNQIGLPLTLFELAAKHRWAVVEMGTSWPGEIARLADIAAPTAGIITNIGSAHLENFKNRDGVFAEKKKLFEALPPNGVAAVNADDPYLSTLAGSALPGVVTYGFSANALVRAVDIELWPDLPHFILLLGSESLHIRLPVHGKFNIMNALAAAACAWKMGIDPDQIKAGLESFSPPKMRMEMRTLASGARVINDAYNANPSSVREAVAGLVQSFPDSDKIVVLGDMLELGDGAANEHARLGEYLANQAVGKIFLFGPLMKNTYAALPQGAAQHFNSKDELTDALRRAATPRSVILVKASRGTRLEEVVEQLSQNQ